MQKLVDKMSAMKLRKALDKLAVICPGGKAEDQVRFIQALKAKHSHSIDFWEETPEVPADFRKSNANVQFNCFMYCLGLRYGDIKKIIGSDGRKIPNSEYMSLLCKKYLTEINRGSTIDGDYILYFSNQKNMHAGKVKNGKVVSKWGSGHVWIHGIFEVPASYGNQVKYYSRVEKSICVKTVREWMGQYCG